MKETRKELENIISTIKGDNLNPKTSGKKLSTKEVMERVLNGSAENPADVSAEKFVFDMKELQYWRERNNERWEINYYRRIYSCRKYIGRFIVFGKKVVRKLLKFLIEPIVKEQKEFNESVTASINALANNEIVTQAFIAYVMDKLAEGQQTKEDLNNRMPTIEKDLATLTEQLGYYRDLVEAALVEAEGNAEAAKAEIMRHIDSIQGEFSNRALVIENALAERAGGLEYRMGECEKELVRQSDKAVSMAEKQAEKQGRIAGFLLDEIYNARYGDPLEQVHRAGTIQQGDKQGIPIVFICDNKYAAPTSVAIVSALFNKNPGTHYIFYVLGSQLSKENINRLEDLSSRVTVIQCENKYADYHFSHPHVSTAALLKFDIPNILREFDKAIYLDSDVLILDDLSELFSEDLGGLYAAAVRDMAGMAGEAHHQKMGHKDYFNTGVMLLNLSRMRQENISQTLLQNKIREEWKRFMDQDVINYTFSEKVCYISPKFNFMYSNLAAYGFPEEKTAKFYNLSADDLRSITKRPVILHMTNKIKPWDSSAAEFYEQYHKYEILAEKYQDLLRDGKALRKSNREGQV